MIGIHKSLQIAPAVKLLISLCLGTVADLLVFGLLNRVCSLPSHSSTHPF